MKRAVFLDRDGVISANTWRRDRWRAPINFKEFRILPDVPISISRLKAMGFLCVVVTNQPEVGSGEIPAHVLSKMHRLLRASIEIDDIFTCIHVRSENCRCRKPKPGLIQEASMKWNIDMARSYMIGDRFSDIEAAKASGCEPILIISEATGKDDAEPKDKIFLATSLSKAVNLIKYLEKGGLR